MLPFHKSIFLKMKFFLAFLLLSLVWLVGASLYMYDIKDHGHVHDVANTPKFENVVVDVRRSFLGMDPDKVVCFRESHRNFYIFTLILMTTIIGLVAYGFVVKNSLSQSLKKKNGEIEEQRKQIAQSNQNLVSSINYARRVQNAFMPTHDDLNQIFKSHFVVNQPRDIVSGDFFWVKEINRSVLLCVGDCTGHGVPAALLTMNAFNLLNALSTDFFQKPGVLMAELHKNLIANLDKSGEEVTDGMDMTLLLFNRDSNVVKFVSAHQSVFVLEGSLLTELKGERRGLGPAYKSATNDFLVQELKLTPGSWIYGFSDGLTDQFGGPQDKKFTKKRLQDLLLTLVSKPAPEQEKTMINAIQDWKGSRPQTDDIILVGVQI